MRISVTQLLVITAVAIFGLQACVIKNLAIPRNRIPGNKVEMLHVIYPEAEQEQEGEDDKPAEAGDKPAQPSQRDNTAQGAADRTDRPDAMAEGNVEEGKVYRGREWWRTKQEPKVGEIYKPGKPDPPKTKQINKALKKNKRQARKNHRGKTRKQRKFLWWYIRLW